MNLDFIWPVLALGAGATAASTLFHTLIFKPLWYREGWQKELLARRARWGIAYNVLHWAYDFSHVKYLGDGQHQLQTARFLTPLGKRVSLWSDGIADNAHPGSFIKVWDWSKLGLQLVPVASINLELDLYHLPYAKSVNWLVAHKDDLEIHSSAQLLDAGVKRVKIDHIWMQDRQQQRLIFRVVFREREKSPGIPEFVPYEETIQDWAEYENSQQKYNRLERLQREQFIGRLLTYAIKEFDGAFPIKKIQAAFDREASHRQIEAIAQRLQGEGILEPGGGPKPRKINVERARAFIER